MKIKKKLKELVRNPRIEVVPSILNLPIVGVILILLIIEPDAGSIINFEAAKLFGVEGDYTTLLIIIGLGLALFILALILLDLKFRERVPVGLFIIPIVSILVLSTSFAFIIFTHDIFSVYYLYVILGRRIGMIIFIVCVFGLLIIGFIMLYSIPRLWNYQLKTENKSEHMEDSNKRLKKKSRFHPHALSIITVIGFVIGIFYIIILIIGYPSMVFWSIIVFGFQWFDPMVILHMVFLVSFVAIFIIRSRIEFLASKLRFTESQINKILGLLIPIVLSIQLLFILILGFTKGFLLYLLNPLSIISLAELLYYILVDWIIKSDRNKTKEGKKSTNRTLFHKDFKRLGRMAFILLPLVFILCFLPLITIPPRPEIPQTDLTIVKNSYATLSTSQKTLFDDIMNDMMPPGSNAADNIGTSGSTRGWIRIAEGLLFRDDPGDRENASYIIDRVLEMQVLDESDSNYGSFYTNFNGEGTDHNWREFIGCELIIILEYHEDKLSNSLIDDMKDALFHASEGAYERNERPSYTNIAMMSAFLMEYVGINMGHPHLENAGIMKSWEVYTLFNRFNTFSEYNSPTYYGVDMVALAIWRDLGPTEEMQRMGKEMELKLWEEIAEFYHAGLKNMVGPFFRAYDMDMNTSYPIIGMSIGLALNNLTLAPMKSDQPYTNFEMTNICPMVHLGHSVPGASVLESFVSFTGPRYLERFVPSAIGPFANDYRVTAKLSENWMMGGVTGKVKENGQFKVGTLHWISSVNDSLAWLLVSGLDYLDVEVSESSMKISQIGRTDKIVFYLNGRNITVSMIDGSKWQLPGIDLNIEGDDSQITAEIVTDISDFKSTYRTGSVETVIKVECSLDSITISPQ